MKLVVISHKVCWPSAASSSGYATDGGFPFQMRALSELFDSTVLVLPRSSPKNQGGGISITGHNLSVTTLTHPFGRGVFRKLLLPFWLAGNSFILIRELLRTDGVHTPIPGDIGTIGMLLGFLLGKPLFVRHCGNWFVQRTLAEHFWRWFLEQFAGGKKIMLATGGAPQPPSQHNPAIGWIFASSLTEQELNSYARVRHRLPPEGARLIIVCRQEREKGTGVVIKSLPFILKDFPRASLDVLGDGKALGEFKRMAAALGVGGRVTFYGRINHEKVLQFLTRADLFCYPTRASEGFPKVVLEALACGLPVVTTPVSILSQLIGSGCGLLIEEATPIALAQAVKKILLDERLYRDMSCRATETAKQYSLERWRDEVGQILEAGWGPLSDKNVKNADTHRFHAK